MRPTRYHDERTGQKVQQAFRPPSALGDSAVPARFQARPGHAIAQNTPSFPVTANDPFTIQVPMRTGLSSATSGYVALIFLNTRSKEVERLRLPFEPIEHPIDTLTTDAQGRFSFLPDSRDLHASIGFRVEFPGDALHRTASAILHWSTTHQMTRAAQATVARKFLECRTANPQGPINRAGGSNTKL
jgi:hypothetical protein